LVKKFKKFNISKAKKPALIVGIVILAIVALIATWIGVNTRPVDRGDTTEVRVDIRSGASVEEVAALLKAKKLIRDPLAFSVFARITFANIQAGTHVVSPAMSASEIIAALRHAANTFTVTILPELMIPEIKRSLIDQGFLEAEVDIALNQEYDHPLLATKPGWHDLEGYIFPDTYELEATATVQDLFKKAFDNLYDKLRLDGSLAYMATRGVSIHETLTLASIVAREAPKLDDQKLIAGVFWSRLDLNVQLGADPTFKYAYAMGYCNVNGPSCQSVYNTRIHAGLPPGPIANMRYDTIQATLHPTDSDYFYFIAGDDGIIRFARTEAEHYANIANYCHILCR